MPDYCSRPRDISVQFGDQGVFIYLALQVFADVAKRYLHEVAAVKQQGSGTAADSLARRVQHVHKRTFNLFREELPQDPAGQVCIV